MPATVLDLSACSLARLSLTLAYKKLPFLYFLLYLESVLVICEPSSLLVILLLFSIGTIAAIFVFVRRVRTPYISNHGQLFDSETILLLGMGDAKEGPTCSLKAVYEACDDVGRLFVLNDTLLFEIKE